MTRPLNNLVLLATLAWLSNAAFAQDPFGEDPFGGAVGRPAPAPGEAAAPAGDAAAPGLTFDPDDPILATIRESNPSTPPELMRAIDTLIDFGAREEAKAYIDKLLALNPPATELIALHKQFGSATFYRLRRDEELGEGATKLADAVMDAAARWASDPRRMEPLIAELSHSDRAIRRSAFAELRRGGAQAVAPLMAVLADESRAAEHNSIRLALVALGEAAAEPLIGWLESDHVELKAEAVAALGRIGSRRALIYLVRPALDQRVDRRLATAARTALANMTGSLPTPLEAETLLVKETERFLAGAPPARPDLDGNVTLWTFAPEQRQPTKIVVPFDDAALYVASQTAADLHAMFPRREEYRRLYLLASLESAKRQAGLSRPLPQGEGSARTRLAAEGQAALSDTLAHAMDTGYVPAAIAACEALGDVGAKAALRSPAGAEVTTPLVDALRHPDRRLRMAAAQAIVRIAPDEPFPGASRLIDALAYLAGSHGQRFALVGHPRRGEGQTMVGMLFELGFEGQAEINGEALQRAAFGMTDLELILISDKIDHPPLSETVQALRKDPRTAGIPIGVIAFSERTLADWKLRAGVDERLEAFAPPAGRETMTAIVQRLLATEGRNLLDQAERLSQAQQALALLLEIQSHPTTFGGLDVMRAREQIARALYTPQLTAPAAELMGRLGDPASQRELVELASQHMRPLAMRQAAVAGFAEAVERRGLLLTTDEIRRQYERYNQTETLDRETQEVMAAVLDIMERKEAPTDADDTQS